MRTVIIRFSTIIIAVFLQISFLNIIFSKNLTIDMLPLIILAWVIIAGFEKIWPWVVMLGIFADLVSFEKVGISVIFFIGIAYAISFFSRRFLIEKKLAGIIVIVVFVVITSLFLDIGKTLIAEKFSILTSYISIKQNVFIWKNIINQNILNISFFYIIFMILNKIEKNIKNYENRINIIS